MWYLHVLAGAGEQGRENSGLRERGEVEYLFAPMTALVSRELWFSLVRCQLARHRRFDLLKMMIIGIIIYYIFGL